LLFIVSGASFISKKIKEQGFLRKSHQKKHTVPLGSGIQDTGSGKNSSRIRIPDPGGKKLRIPDPGSATLARLKLFCSYLNNWCWYYGLGHVFSCTKIFHVKILTVLHLNKCKTIFGILIDRRESDWFLSKRCGVLKIKN
jgi:hypothetical protein